MGEVPTGRLRGQFFEMRPFDRACSIFGWINSGAHVKISTMARTILLIEDDEYALGLMAAALEKQGHTVFKAKDASEAQNQWSPEDRHFDLLISDVKLPDDDGFVLAERLLETRPDVPVMFISGDKDCFASASIRAFADSPFIAKPFNVKQMLAAVDKVLSKQ
jgi:DNA-binding NtrC family response regulator